MILTSESCFHNEKWLRMMNVPKDLMNSSFKRGTFVRYKFLELVLK
jgi:hypothetical protein